MRGKLIRKFDNYKLKPFGVQETELKLWQQKKEVEQFTMRFLRNLNAKAKLLKKKKREGCESLINYGDK